MSGMFSSLRKNLGGFLRASLNPTRILTDREDRQAVLDPLDLTKAPEVPKPEPVIPLPDEEMLKRTRRRSSLRRARSGRDSTIMTETLG
jgi:hypothetical protein